MNDEGDSERPEDVGARHLDESKRSDKNGSGHG